jgi:hypothetical protein
MAACCELELGNGHVYFQMASRKCAEQFEEQHELYVGLTFPRVPVRILLTQVQLRTIGSLGFTADVTLAQQISGYWVVVNKRTSCWRRGHQFHSCI